jgi:hypothetical protein
VITPEHLPFYQARKSTVTLLAQAPGLRAARKAVLGRELEEINTVLDTAHPKGHPCRQPAPVPNPSPPRPSRPVRPKH